MTINPEFLRRRSFKHWKEALRTNRLHQDLDQLHKTAVAVAKGLKPGLCIPGVPGIGKSHLLIRALHEAGVIKDINNIKANEYVASSPKTWEDLVKDFDRARDLGVPIVLEEGDRVLTNAMKCEVLKVAGNVGGNRFKETMVDEAYETTNRNGEPMIKTRRVPKTVWLTAPLFITTNLNVNKFLDSALIDRWGARQLPVDRATIWEYVVALALTQDLIKDVDVPKVDKAGHPIKKPNGEVIMRPQRVRPCIQNRALAFITENLWLLQGISIRVLKNVVADLIAIADEQNKWHIDDDEAAITMRKYLAATPDPKMAHNPVPANPTVFDWKIVAGLVEDIDEFDAAGEIEDAPRTTRRDPLANLFERGDHSPMGRAANR